MSVSSATCRMNVALPGHVRSGDEPERTGLRSERRVVRDERAGEERDQNGWRPSRCRARAPRRARAGRSFARGEFGKRREKSAAAVLRPRSITAASARDGIANLEEQLQFERAALVPPPSTFSPLLRTAADVALRRSSKSLCECNPAAPSRRSLRDLDGNPRPGLRDLLPRCRCA